MRLLRKQNALILSLFLGITSCVDRNKVEPFSPTESYRNNAIVLTPPQDLKLSNVTSSGAQASWQPAGLSVSGYRIKTVPGGNSGTCSDGTLVTGNSFTFSGLSPSTLYTVSLCSVDSQNRTSSSVVASFTTLSLPLPSAPTSLSVTSITKNSAQASWQPAGLSVSGYRIKTIPGGNSGTCSDGTLVTGNSFTFSGLSPSTLYTISLCSVDSQNRTSSIVTTTFRTLSDLSCSLAATPNNIIFGQTVVLTLTTTGNPTSASIESHTVPPLGGSIRYTPEVGGLNTVNASISRSGQNTTCSTVVTTLPPPIPESAACDPFYQVYNAGNYGMWLGADGGLTFNLSGNRTLSLFGDTYLGAAGQLNRPGSNMVGNTISLSSCSNGAYQPVYHWWGFQKTAKALFQPPSSTVERYWPLWPWSVGNKLFIPQTVVKNTNSGIGFQIIRTDIGIIDNPNEAPSLWNIQYKTLFNQVDFGGASNNVVFGDYVYLFNSSNPDITLSRLSISSLAQNAMAPNISMEYLTKQGDWKPGYLDSDAKRLGVYGNSGISVRYNFKLKKWIMVYLDSPGWVNNKVVIKTANRLEGPWSEAVTLYQIPEVTPGNRLYDARNLCYQAIEHIVFNSDPDNQVALTYSCNSLDFQYALSNMNFYFPKFIRVSIPRL